MGCCKPATTPQRASLLCATLPCKTALLLFLDVDRRRKLKGRARTQMSHHQIPRLDGDQAERCDGNLPFASRLVALLSMTVHWTGQAIVEGGSLRLYKRDKVELSYRPHLHSRNGATVDDILGSGD